MNNYFNNAYPGAGYGYANQKKAVSTNPLTEEELKYLAQKNPAFSLSVSKEEQLQAVCTHRDKNTGEVKLRQNNDGTVTCMICGKTFRMIDSSQDNIDKIFDAAVDALETTKVMYVDIPNDVCRQFFQMSPFISKAKGMYKIANDHFGQYGSALNPQMYNNTNAAAFLASMYNTGYGYGMGMPPQPGVAYGYGQPVAPGYAAPQPGVAPAAPQPAPAPAPGVNVFDANASNPAPAPAEVTDNKTYQL